MTDLLEGLPRCPFCRGNDFRITFAPRVECLTCGALGPEGKTGFDYDVDAVAKWTNRKTPDDMISRPGLTKRLLGMIHQCMRQAKAHKAKGDRTTHRLIVERAGAFRQILFEIYPEKFTDSGRLIKDEDRNLLVKDVNAMIDKELFDPTPAKALPGGQR